jgi:hypothetical protein
MGPAPSAEDVPAALPTVQFRVDRGHARMPLPAKRSAKKRESAAGTATPSLDSHRSGREHLGGKIPQLTVEPQVTGDRPNRPQTRESAIG